MMHDGIPYGRNQGQGQGHSREVDRQSPTGLIFIPQASEDLSELVMGHFFKTQPKISGPNPTQPTKVFTQHNPSSTFGMAY